MCTRLAEVMAQKHSDKWLPKGGLGGRAYAELRIGPADWPEWTTLLKSPIWTDASCAELRSRLQNPSGNATVTAAKGPTGTGALVRVELEFGDWKKLIVAGPTIGSVVGARGTQCVYVEATKDDIPHSQDIIQIANGGTPVIVLGRGTLVQDWLDQNCTEGASQTNNFRTVSTIYLGSAEERQLFLPDPKQTGLAGSLVMAMLSPKAMVLPSYIGSQLGLRASVMAFPMLKLGLKPDLNQGNFRCLALALNPGRTDGMLLTASLADEFPRWQISVVTAPHNLSLFDKDLATATSRYYGIVSADLAHEVTLLCKGQVLDDHNIAVLSVEERAAQRRRVGELVAQHKREQKTKAQKEKAETKKAVKTALQERKTERAAQSSGAALETATVAAQADETSILGNSAQTPTKAAAARQDAADIVAANAGTPAKAGTSTGSGTASPGSKKRPARAPGLQSKRPKPSATAEPAAHGDRLDVLGTTELEALFVGPP